MSTTTPGIAAIEALLTQYAEALLDMHGVALDAILLAQAMDAGPVDAAARLLRERAMEIVRSVTR